MFEDNLTHFVKTKNFNINAVKNTMEIAFIRFDSHGSFNCNLSTFLNALLYCERYLSCKSGLETFGQSTIKAHNTISQILHLQLSPLKSSATFTNCTNKFRLNLGILVDGIKCSTINFPKMLSIIFDSLFISSAHDTAIAQILLSIKKVL